MTVNLYFCMSFVRGDYITSKGAGGGRTTRVIMLRQRTNKDGGEKHNVVWERTCGKRQKQGRDRKRRTVNATRGLQHATPHHEGHRRPHVVRPGSRGRKRIQSVNWGNAGRILKRAFESQVQLLVRGVGRGWKRAQDSHNAAALGLGRIR